MSSLSPLEHEAKLGSICAASKHLASKPASLLAEYVAPAGSLEVALWLERDLQLRNSTFEHLNAVGDARACYYGSREL